MSLRSVIDALNGFYWYWPRLDREPIVYLLVVGIAIVGYAGLLWAPMSLLGFITACVQRHVRQSVHSA